VRRTRRWFWRGAIASALVGATVPATAVLLGPQARDAAYRTSPPAVVAPTAVARPVHLNSSYRPARPARATVMGQLHIARLRLAAPIVAVGWDGDTMAVPTDPGQLGWFSPSARREDLAGVSLIAGPVSDTSDRPGPLAALEHARVGHLVLWQGSGGISRFRVTSIQRFPRSRGLPAALFHTDGPHILRVVTCATRVVGPSGVHYTDNLVVSAVQG